MDMFNRSKEYKNQKTSDLDYTLQTNEVNQLKRLNYCLIVVAIYRIEDKIFFHMFSKLQLMGL